MKNIFGWHWNKLPCIINYKIKCVRKNCTKKTNRNTWHVFLCESIDRKWALLLEAIDRKRDLHFILKYLNSVQWRPILRILASNYAKTKTLHSHGKNMDCADVYNEICACTAYNDRWSDHNCMLWELFTYNFNIEKVAAKIWPLVDLYWGMEKDLSNIWKLLTAALLTAAFKWRQAQLLNLNINSNEAIF